MWYAVQVETGREEQALGEILRTAELRGVCDAIEEAFVPKRRIFERVNGEMTQREVALYPGYLIIVARRRDIDTIARTLRRTPRFARLLAYDGVFTPLLDEEVEWVCAFTQRGQHTIGVSEGFIERGRVTVVSGPLIGREAAIVKVNRRKRTARVRLSFCGRVVETEFTLELMKQNKDRRCEGAS